MSAGSLHRVGASAATPLRKLPALKGLVVQTDQIGDEGVASLFANLGKDDFKALEKLDLHDNKITDAGCAMVEKAIDAGGLPAVRRAFDVNLESDFASEEATAAVDDALARQGAEPWRPPGP